MTYWRMQMHPNDTQGAIKYTVESIGAGYIGLDFKDAVPDMITVSKDQLPDNQRNFWAFAHEMAIGDHVLLFTHHFPFALFRVAGDYNYICSRVPELGVWFRHFRQVDHIQYVGDIVTNAREWERAA